MHARRHSTRLTALFAAMVLSGCSLFEPAPLPDPPADATVASDPPGAVAPTTPSPVRSTIRWRRCGEDFQCGSVRVPASYERRTGKTIKLALIRLRAPVPQRRIGSLIVNPGGPGGSGVDFVRQAAVDTIPAELRARFDIVGFDPRGVGASRPVSCGNEPERFLARDLASVNQATVADVLRAAQSLASACQESTGAFLKDMSTAAVARDLDRIRAAVGDAQLNFLGFSYGTFIGMTYAELFPRRVRALVLDGPVDPALGWVERAREQGQTLERTLAQFFRECRSDRECQGRRLGLSLQRFKALIARLERDPVPAPYVGSDRFLRSSEALLATALLLKERGTGWRLLAAGLVGAMRGDGSLLLSIAEGTTGKSPGRRAQNGLAPLLAVNCIDIPAPAPATYADAATQLSKQSPHFGGLMLLISAPCAFWPVKPLREPARIVAPDAPPAVVIGTTGDPTTPYRWAQRVSDALASGRLVTRTGSGHTGFGGLNVCTDRHVIPYLISLTVPPEGATCG